MRKIIVITCFSYPDNQKYVFNPSYLKADLRRIIAFTHNQIGANLEDIYVLTDLIPSERTRKEILADFQSEVKQYLRRSPIYSQALELCSGYSESPLRWLHEISKTFPGEGLYQKILHTLLPIIKTQTAVEFASLFTNFIPIKGKDHYDSTLKTLFRKDASHLFFYYTGHGVKLLSREQNWSPDFSLVIPVYRSSIAEYYPRDVLQKRFSECSAKQAFVVFDCCYGENFLKFPFKLSFTERGERKMIQTGTDPSKKGEIIYLSSTRDDQTCGFYTSEKEYGSVYTYYLIKFLLSSSGRNLTDLYSGVEEKVKRYRGALGKPPQNMLIGLSSHKIRELPQWLFDSNTRRLIEVHD